MKKLLAILLCLLLVCSVFAGCDAGGKGNRTGTEIAKLMLANSRLDESLLTGGSDIDSFAEVKAQPLSAFVPQRDSFTTLAATKSGDKISWSDFSGEANTYEFFESYIANIESMAQRGARLIESFKKDYNITDYWVKNGDEKYLFQVNSNEEILYTKYAYGFFICKRYTNANAQDVYEMFVREAASDISVDHYTRMLYIPDVRYEYSYEQPAVKDNVYIVAEKQRGYWNMFYVTDIEGEGANFSNLVTTSGIAFDYSNRVNATPTEGQIPLIRFSTADLKNDIITFSEDTITLHLAAFNGVSAVTIPESKSEFIEGNGGGYVATVAEGSIVTTSGKTIAPKDTFAGGTVTFSGALADEKRLEEEGTKTFAYADFKVQGETVTQRFANLKAALSEMGLSSKYSIDNVAANVPYAEAIGNQFTNYYDWNGFNLSTYSNVSSSIAVEDGKAAAFDAMFDKIKDNKSVVSTPKGLRFENYSFAALDSFTSGNVSFDGNIITVKDMSAIINDLTLLDVGKEYTINLALARITGTGNETLSSTYKSGNITLSDITLLNDTEADYDRAVILEKVGGSAVKFVADNSSLSLKESAEFKLPSCQAPGDYTIVAYAATADSGIRISSMLPVAFTSAQETSLSSPGIDGSFSLNGEKELVAKYLRNLDIFLEKSGSFTYAQALDELKKAAFNYGMPIEGAVMEVYNTATNSGSPAQSGKNYSSCVLRLKYTATDKSGATKPSYIYLTIK